MASSPSPSTPVSTPRRTALSRSFTVPAKAATALRPANAQAEIGTTDGIETLYRHPYANIVKFTTKTSQPSSSSSPGRPQSSSGTLPWATSTEIRAATGPLEIYRVPGSVSFFRSGNFVHPILPKSQCWCVDGASKFVFRGPDAYYRIELPGESEEDVEEVEKFKGTLKKVLVYERTFCPFARGFSVELPEEPVAMKKTRRKSTGPAKRWKLDRAHSWKPEGWVPPEQRGSGDESGSSSTSGSVGGSEDEESEAASGPEDHGNVGGNKTPAKGGKVNELVGEFNVKSSSPPPRASPLPPRISRGMGGMRSVTAPQLNLQSTAPSRLRTNVDVDGTIEVSESAGEESRDEDTQTLRTFQAIPTDMPPSPPDSSAGLEYLENRVRREIALDDDRNPEAEDLAIGGAERTEENSTERAGEGISGDVDLETKDQRAAISSIDDNESQETNDVVQTSADHTELHDDALLIDQATPKTPTEYTSPPPLDSPLSDHQPSPTSRPTTPLNQTTPEEDPYAAIQARILARRSIGGTTSFHPLHKTPPPPPPPPPLLPLPPPQQPPSPAAPTPVAKTKLSPPQW